MYTLEFFTDYINKAISEFSFPQDPKGLYEPIEYTIADGGKRLRPILALASCVALGGDVELVRNQALGIEMFHNFTLMHDDVMDRSDTRRGKPTVHVRWNNSTAILSGDAMLTMATMLVSQCDDSKMHDVMTLFNQTAMEVYEGQQYDMDFEQRTDVTIDEYLEMIKLKTSVLFGCSCEIGAIMAGADMVDRKSFYDFGVKLGLAFQLQDDYLDTYGDSATFGKKIGGDIINDKKTWLLITALAEDTSGELQSIVGNKDIDPEIKIDTVRTIYDRLNLGKRCQKLIKQYVQAAIDEIDAMPLMEDSDSFFKSIVDSLVGRTR